MEGSTAEFFTRTGVVLEKERERKGFFTFCFFLFLDHAIVHVEVI